MGGPYQGDPICYNCGGRGHFAKKCPSPRSEKAFGKRTTVDSKTRGKTARTELGSNGNFSDTKLEVNQTTEMKNVLMSPLIMPKQGLYIQGIVRSTNVQFLIDSGSTDTILSGSVFYQIPVEKRPILQINEVRVRQANGSLMGNIMGTAELDIQVGQTVIPVCAIFADIPVPGILGMDFFLPARGTLDFRSLELNVNGEKIKCTDEVGSVFCYRVVVEKTTSVPAGHEAIVPGYIKTDGNGVDLGLIEPVENAGELSQRGLVLARTLVKAEREPLV